MKNTGAFNESAEEKQHRQPGHQGGHWLGYRLVPLLQQQRRESHRPFRQKRETWILQHRDQRGHRGAHHLLEAIRNQYFCIFAF